MFLCGDCMQIWFCTCIRYVASAFWCKHSWARFHCMTLLACFSVDCRQHRNPLEWPGLWTLWKNSRFTVLYTVSTCLHMSCQITVTSCLGWLKWMPPIFLFVPHQKWVCSNWSEPCLNLARSCTYIILWPSNFYIKLPPEMQSQLWSFVWVVVCTIWKLLSHWLVLSAFSIFILAGAACTTSPSTCWRDCSVGGGTNLPAFSLATSSNCLSTQGTWTWCWTRPSL